MSRDFSKILTVALHFVGCFFEKANMLTEIVLNANVMQSLQGLAAKVTSRLFRSSGWSIPDDTDTGISFGADLEVGGGYMEMDIQDNRSTPNKQFEIRGGYVEIGVGIGEISKGAQTIIKKIASVFKGAKPSSDIVIMPGGSIGGFIMGVMQEKTNLELDDFKLASWLYLNVGAEAAVVSGDIGIMYMLDHGRLGDLAIDFGKAVATRDVGTVLEGLMKNCKAWAPYYGTSLGLGLGGKSGIRFIQSVHLK